MYACVYDCFLKCMSADMVSKVEPSGTQDTLPPGSIIVCGATVTTYCYIDSCRLHRVTLSNKQGKADSMYIKNHMNPSLYSTESVIRHQQDTNIWFSKV